MMMMMMHIITFTFYLRGRGGYNIWVREGGTKGAERNLYLQKCVFLSCSFAFFSAGNIPSDRLLTEEDWAVDEGISPYEKSKLRAEKTAWELVKNLPGEQQGHFVIDVVPIFLLNVNKGSARNILVGSLTAYKRRLKTSRFSSSADPGRP